MGLIPPLRMQLWMPGDQPLTAPGVAAHPDDPRGPTPRFLLTRPEGIAQLGVLEGFPWAFAGTFVDEGPLSHHTDTSPGE